MIYRSGLFARSSLAPDGWPDLQIHFGLLSFDRIGSDPLAVVDHRLRVRGVQVLRVIDGSVLPAINPGNTTAPVIMIGEKASDLIKKDLRS